MNTLIIPRADNEKDETLKAFGPLSQKGLNILFVPFFHVHLDANLPFEYQKCSSVCVTSRNGIRALEKIYLPNKQFLFVTGLSSLKHAREKLFYENIIHSLDGKVSGMIQAIAAHKNRIRKPLLYIRGDIIRTPLKELFESMDIPLLEHIGYHLHPNPSGVFQLQRALTQNPFGVCVLSQRMAHKILDILKNIPQNPKVIFFSLSPEITQTLSKFSTRIQESPAPCLDALKLMIANFYGKTLYGNLC